jgi:uncharacterized caspase-like protein
MSEPEKLVQVILNLGADVQLSQAEADALLKELETQVSQQMAGSSVEIINKNSPEESLSKGEPLVTLAVVIIRYAVPKLLDLLLKMIKEHRNNRLQVFAKVGAEQITIDSRTDPTELQEIQERVQATDEGEEAHERRFALLIGMTTYQDSRLNQLVSPEMDIRTLADTLKDPAIGGYDDVNLLLNESSSVILQAVEHFFKRKANTDLLLLYFSGHGVRGERDKLYLAAANTNLELLNSTALPSDFIKEAMDSSNSERQILILDCCYSGSFLNRSRAGAIKGSIGDHVNTAGAFKGNGFGRVILTATDRTQVAWEGQRVTGQVEKSVFTEHLIEGLKTGNADDDRDGWIGLEELYKYVYKRMVTTSKDQTPEMNAFNMKGTIILARNPKPKPVELPPELQSLIDHPYADVRITAVSKLSQLFENSQYGMALAARKALEKLAVDDSRMVSDAAGKALGILPSEKPPPPEPSEPRRAPAAPGRIPPAASIPVTNRQPADFPRQPAPPSQPGPWWTQIQPLPGTRSGAGTKSGPSLVEDPYPGSDSKLPPSVASAPVRQASVQPSNTAYPAFQNPSTQKTGGIQTPESLALLAGVLSVLIFFLPVWIWGFIVGLRAMKTTSNSPQAVAGFVLSCIALTIELILILYLIAG